jgi:hypothetical protein
MTLDTTTRRPKPGDFARWDEHERHVLCHRRSGEGGVCSQILALPHLWRVGGRTVRLLRLPHTDWELHNGIWREGAATRRRRQLAWEPRRRTSAYHDTPARHNLVARYIRSLPAWLRCPGCDNKRYLDGDVLAAVGEDATSAWWEQQRGD